jgi:Tfp pilus assembly protein PilX
MPIDARYINRLAGGPASQQGLALVVALIALAAMGLAAVALVWAVETNVRAEGNLAFQTSAWQFAGQVAEDARVWLLDNQASLSATQADGGYYAADPAESGVCGQTGWSGVDFTDACTKTASSQVAWKEADGTALPGGITPKCEAVDKATGELGCYVIHRLCAKEGSADPSNAAYPEGQDCPQARVGTASTKDGASQGPDSSSIGANTASTGVSVVYRITVRIGGARGNAAYAQTFVRI